MIEYGVRSAQVLAAQHFYLPKIEMTHIGQTEEGFFCQLKENQFLSITHEGCKFTTDYQLNTPLWWEDYAIPADTFLFWSTSTNGANFFPSVKIFHFPTGTLYIYSPSGTVYHKYRMRPDPKTFQSHKVRQAVLFTPRRTFHMRTWSYPLYATKDFFIFGRTHNILHILDLAYPVLQIFPLPAVSSINGITICTKREDHYDFLVESRIYVPGNYYTRLSRVRIAFPEGFTNG